jgi:ABC-type microcin C transport system duplicated ATPase subunit YejF
VGESGCGKSLTGLSILGLLPPGIEVFSGKILFEGRDLLTLSPEEMRRLRGKEIAMIFQDPMTALNPVFTVGAQIAEVLTLHRGLRAREAEEEAVRLLAEVGIPSPRERLRSYPQNCYRSR